MKPNAIQYDQIQSEPMPILSNPLQMKPNAIQFDQLQSNSNCLNPLQLNKINPNMLWLYWTSKQSSIRLDPIQWNTIQCYDIQCKCWGEDLQSDFPDLADISLLKSGWQQKDRSWFQYLCKRFDIFQLYQLQCFHASIFSLFPVAAKILAFQGGTKDYLKQGEGEFRRGRDKLR